MPWSLLIVPIKAAIAARQAAIDRQAPDQAGGLDKAQTKTLRPAGRAGSESQPDRPVPRGQERLGKVALLWASRLLLTPALGLSAWPEAMESFLWHTPLAVLLAQTPLLPQDPPAKLPLGKNHDSLVTDRVGSTHLYVHGCSEDMVGWIYVTLASDLWSENPAADSIIAIIYYTLYNNIVVMNALALFM